MKLPDSVDEEIDEVPGQENRTNITTKILESKREMFFKNDQIALMPFGTASHIHSDGTGLDGFLAFDVNQESRVVFVHSADCVPVSISESFSAMMTTSIFQFFG